MDMQSAIRTLTEGKSLEREEMRDAMRLVMTGEATPAQIGGFLIALRMTGETVDEIAAAAAVMRELATGVKVIGPHVVDIVGTGGDGISTFNISTTASFIVAACGGQVAKHGNRNISSRSGAADLLEAAGEELRVSGELRVSRVAGDEVLRQPCSFHGFREGLHSENLPTRSAVLSVCEELKFLC